MHATEAIGYLASALVFATFYMSTMKLLRMVAIASNVAFILYGYFAGAMPIVVLHLVLLPLNVWRLYQTTQLTNSLRAATRGNLGIDWLVPHMTPRSYPAGATIFRKGDLAQELFIITSGSVHLPELEIELGKGAMVGEIGIFSPNKARVASAVALTPIRVLVISEERVLELFADNKEFGYYLVSLITKRLLANVDELEWRVSDASSSEAPPAWDAGSERTEKA
jgi:CRP/FNR family transcriptional regulator, cyclic AMP receptor protein